MWSAEGVDVVECDSKPRVNTDKIVHLLWIGVQRGGAFDQSNSRRIYVQAPWQLETVASEIGCSAGW